MDGTTGFFGFGSILILIVMVFTVLLPFFVFKIRNEVVKMNKKMDQIINLLGNDEKNKVGYKVEPSSYGTDKMIKICQNCGRKNRNEDLSCVECGSPFIS